MKPSNPGEKSFLTTKKKGNVIINPKKEDLMKETKLDEKKLDAVGKEDKDIDNDGDHDKSDRYLLNRRKVRSKVIKMKEAAYDALRAKRAKKPQGEGAVDTAPDESNVGESVEQIDELSKKTLGSYIKGATSDRSTDLGNAKNMKHAAKLVKKGMNREKGVHTAVDKIMKKEETEQLDEISSKKLIDASKAAEKARGMRAAAGDTEGAKKALAQGKKFGDAARGRKPPSGSYKESIDRMKAKMIQFTKDHDLKMQGKQPI